MKLSVSLIDTYKHINTVYYYQERDHIRRRNTSNKPNNNNQKGVGDSGTPVKRTLIVNNNFSYNDKNSDYIITPGETVLFDASDGRVSYKNHGTSW
jgi:hypothetical protein